MVEFVEVEPHEGVGTHRITDEAVVETCLLTYRTELGVQRW